MGEIVKPFGEHRTPGPVDKVVEHLRRLLEEAERGEVIGLQWAVVRPNNVVQYGYIPGTADCHHLVSGVTLAQGLLVKDLIEE